ncbi:MAG: hypothetical protein UY76_C0022G0003 [Candidatus Uhrbacteria bacterium GW2011_GWA2_52_8d]|uniref:DUF5640 domain-containing protein n=1 Tax=Candidatus Uhrbacteria bacterium GW2011_GWA2_52_8d TaxID=1618979 RepID=A0A0G1XMY0_9BACT|nr:MAG: hypothetical protein UY76_C0022G0003 [Candidatus Uhrbacteria bacterium GW2011_GWA2_52_8d]
MKAHHIALLILAVVIVGGFFLWPQTNIQVPVDELTGTWRGEASPEAEYQWWMEYEFENGGYTLITDSSYQEEGTYEITERFLDGSILVKKVYADGTKEYEMNILTTVDDPNVISIEGTTLSRQ